MLYKKLISMGKIVYVAMKDHVSILFFEKEIP